MVISMRKKLLIPEYVLDPEFVLEQARALDQIPYNERGPLHGLAIGIKDIANTKGTA